jgi:hypothetical protein
MTQRKMVEARFKGSGKEWAEGIVTLLRRVASHYKRKENEI